MSSLLNIQSRFSTSVTKRVGDIQPWLAETDVPGLDIYTNAYRIRLLDTLAQDYPALKQLMGEQLFNKMASQFIEEHPSKSYTLRLFGEQLGHFLTNDSYYRQRPYLAELARFEWHLTDIFDVADTPVASVADMSQIPAQAWPALTIKLHASIRRLTALWNISDIYPELKSKSDSCVIEKNAQKHAIFIWRKNNSPHYRVLDPAELLAIQTFETSNFSELCMMLAQSAGSDETAALQAATYLKSWLQAGFIESIN